MSTTLTAPIVKEKGRSITLPGEDSTYSRMRYLYDSKQIHVGDIINFPNNRRELVDRVHDTAMVSIQGVWTTFQENRGGIFVASRTHYKPIGTRMDACYFEGGRDEEEQMHLARIDLLKEAGLWEEQK